MKVYVVVPDYGIGEGYGEPDSAFATRELAKAEVDRTFNTQEIFELEVIGAPAEQTQQPIGVSADGPTDVEVAACIVDHVNVYGRQVTLRYPNEERLIYLIAAVLRASFEQGLKAGAEAAAVAGLAERYNKGALQRMKREP